MNLNFSGNDYKIMLDKCCKKEGKQKNILWYTFLEEAFMKAPSFGGVKGCQITRDDLETYVKIKIS